MNDDKNLISLKEASQKTGYSPDYIGQLIRSGKIFGKQVYYNVAWMTTIDAVLEYKGKAKQNRSKSKFTFSEFVKNNIRKISLEIGLLKLFVKSFKTVVPILLFIIILFSLLLSLLFNFFTEQKESTIGHPPKVVNELTF